MFGCQGVEPSEVGLLAEEVYDLFVELVVSEALASQVGVGVFELFAECVYLVCVGSVEVGDPGVGVCEGGLGDLSVAAVAAQEVSGCCRGDDEGEK